MVSIPKYFGMLNQSTQGTQNRIVQKWEWWLVPAQPTKPQKPHTQTKISRRSTIWDKNRKDLLSGSQEITNQSWLSLFTSTVHLWMATNANNTTNHQKFQTIYQNEDLEMIYHLGQKLSKPMACGPRKHHSKLTYTKRATVHRCH